MLDTIHRNKLLSVLLALFIAQITCLVISHWIKYLVARSSSYLMHSTVGLLHKEVLDEMPMS
jgi:hypothetical protein